MFRYIDYMHHDFEVYTKAEQYLEVPFMFESENDHWRSIVKFQGKYYECRSKFYNFIFIEEVKINLEPEDTKWEHEITCPVCGYVDRDSWEEGDYNDDYECSCGAILEVERHVEVTYSASVKTMPDIVETK